MWFAKRKDGTYCQERIINPINGEEKIISVKVTHGKRDAMDKLNARIESLGFGNLHLSQLVQKYIKEQETLCKDSTVRRNEGTLNVITKTLGDPFLEKLTAGFIREKFLATGKPAGTLNEYIARLKACLRWGYENDLLNNYDVIGKLKLFKDTPHREKIADKYLEKDELNKLIESMDVEKWKLATEFLSLSGLRIGELMALDWKDIDDTYIHVTKTCDVHSMQLTSTKTMNSTRDVFIQPELRECINKINALRKRNENAIGFLTDVFLPNADGSRFAYFGYNTYLKRKAKEILGRSISPHTLRHTHCSLLCEAGVSLDAISRRLGHSTKGITEQIYLHVTSTMKKHDNDEINVVSILA